MQCGNVNNKHFRNSKKWHVQVDMQGLALDGSSKPSESLGNPTRMRCGEGTGPW